MSTSRASAPGDDPALDQHLGRLQPYRIVCSRRGTRVFCSNRRYGIWLRFTWLG